MVAAHPFGLLVGLFGDKEMAAIFSEDRMISSWLETEVALAAAQAETGQLPPDIAEAIAVAGQLGTIDREILWREARNIGYPILPLVRMIDAALSPEAAGHVHYGATTQDIMDTGLSLQLRDALDRLAALLDRFGGAIAELVDHHRDTVLAARTHAQQAVPTTFGAKLSVLLAELARQQDRLTAVRPRAARVSLFGAGGTSAALGDTAPAVRAAMARRLRLEHTDVPWHVARDCLADFGLVCASVAATCARFAREVVDLSRTEIGEVGEPAGHHRGASSTMPQKSNPKGSEVVIGMAATAGALASSLFRIMEAGHERAAGEWQIEWEVIPMLATLAAGSLANAAEIAEGLRVFPETMRRNLIDGDGYVMAEAHMMRLASELGRERAHDLVYQAVVDARERGDSLESALARAIDNGGVATIEPEEYVGRPALACDAALDAWRAARPAPANSAPSISSNTGEQ